jgi:hypothetical protein
MNVIIISHRRSGTHLAMDTILNNFKFDKIYNLDSLENVNHPLYKETSTLNLKKIDNKIFKSHMPNIEYFKKSNKFNDIKSLYDNSKIIYVKREVKDMLTSFYHYFTGFNKKYKKDIHEFIRDERFTGTIKKQNENFKDNFTINYEDLINDYKQTIKKISNYIGAESYSLVDVRNKKEGLISAVSYRKGIVGDYKNYLNDEDIEYLDKYMKS